MDVATRISQQSQEPQGKYVGCLIVRGDQWLSYSYNGTLPGSDKPMRDENGNSTEHVIHAEFTAIAKAARQGVSLAGSTLYCTHLPCISCAQCVSLAGITRVVWRDWMKKSTSIKSLDGMGFTVERITPYGVRYCSPLLDTNPFGDVSSLSYQRERSTT
jgi:dCMP deaminase